MSYYNYSNPAELYHHGIIGMKWGVRRYQNEDGTLTAAGKHRYASNADYNERVRGKARSKNEAIQRDIDSLKPYSKTGIKDTKGRQMLTSQDVKSQIRSLEDQQRKNTSRAEYKVDRKKFISDKSTARNVAVVLLNGPFGATTYNNMRMNGYSRAESYGAAWVSSALGGAIGNAMVSSRLRSKYEKEHS